MLVVNISFVIIRLEVITWVLLKDEINHCYTNKTVSSAPVELATRTFQSDTGIICQGKQSVCHLKWYRRTGSFQIKMNVPIVLYVPTDDAWIRMEVFAASVIPASPSTFLIRTTAKVNWLDRCIRFHSIRSRNLDINECYSSDNCTGNNEVCLNTKGSYQCVCETGYQRDANNHCISKESFEQCDRFLPYIDVDECAEWSEACDLNSRCEDRNGSFACCMKTIVNECIGMRSEWKERERSDCSIVILECGYDYTRARTSRELCSSRLIDRNNLNVLDTDHARRRRLVDGQPVQAGQFPWVAALLVKQAYYNYEPRYVCSASLVSSWIILTAAHCLDEQHFRT